MAGAYNFYDADGDGWGDTWYARWKTTHVDLDPAAREPGRPVPLPQLRPGVPALARADRQARRHYADEDLELFTSAAALRAAYDLIVFPGHTEYVTGRLYDLVQGYRDLGGNLMFLAANNFFRRVDRRERRLTLIDEWRDLGRPESALLGIQYIATDRGQRHGAVHRGRRRRSHRGRSRAPGSRTARSSGSTGSRSTRAAPDSPPGTQVLATIPNLFGPGYTAEMTYYEHSSGAQVFSAGALDFGGQILLWPATAQLLANVWQRLA